MKVLSKKNEKYSSQELLKQATTRYNKAMELFTLRNFIIVLALIVGIEFYRSSHDQNTTSLSLPLDTKIVAFGDSLTQGYGVLPEQSYPAVLAERLHVEVVNEGISGETSAQGLARLASVLDRTRPDILVLCHGGNDILRQNETRQTKANISAMVQLAQDRGIYVLLVGVATLDIVRFSVPSFYYEIAKERSLIIEDESLKAVQEGETLRGDAVHPNAQGYALMAEKIALLLSEHYIPSSRP